MTAPLRNRRFVLVARPDGLPKQSDFRLEDGPVAAPGPGEVLVRNHYASLDPAIRGWLDDTPSYLPPVALGDAVRASTVGRIEASNAAGYAPGDWVMGLNRIEEFSTLAPDAFMHRIDATLTPSVTHYLSSMGAVGLTAWFGVSEIMKPEAGQTLVGIAGGPEKCARLIDRFGFDAAIDYRGRDLDALSGAIGAACPQGIDLVFENVGGIGLDATLLHINQKARIILCGLISEYNGARHGTRNLWQLIVKTATMRGYLVSEFVDRFPEGSQAIADLIGQGKLVFDEHIDDGIDQAFNAFMRLFDGSNQGKMLLKLI